MNGAYLKHKKIILNICFKRLYIVSETDDIELSGSVTKLESCLSNIIDSFEIDQCLKKLKLSEEPSGGSSTEV